MTSVPREPHTSQRTEPKPEHAGHSSSSDGSVCLTQDTLGQFSRRSVPRRAQAAQSANSPAAAACTAPAACSQTSHPQCPPKLRRVSARLAVGRLPPCVPTYLLPRSACPPAPRRPPAPATRAGTPAAARAAECAPPAPRSQSLHSPAFERPCRPFDTRCGRAHSDAGCRLCLLEIIEIAAVRGGPCVKMFVRCRREAWV